eukprot:SAG22_NODE_783_length_7251_cov_18.263423_5_plen_251_part_00
MKYFQNYHGDGQVYDDSADELLQLLPQRMANNIVCQMHQDLIRMNGALFLSMDVPLRAAFCLKLSPAFAHRNETLYEKGDIALDLFIILEGEVQLHWHTCTRGASQRRAAVNTDDDGINRLSNNKSGCCGSPGVEPQISTEISSTNLVNTLSKHEIFGVAGLVGLGSGAKKDRYTNTAVATQSDTKLLFLTRNNVADLDAQFDGLVTRKLKGIVRCQEQWLRLERVRLAVGDTVVLINPPLNSIADPYES